MNLEVRKKVERIGGRTWTRTVDPLIKSQRHFFICCQSYHLWRLFPPNRINSLQEP